MAQNKKSFILYCDLIHVIEKLVLKDREQKTNYGGELFLHILEYVNDKNPIPIDFIVEMSFEPIKQQFKRDLIKYSVIVDRNKENGKLGGRPKNPTKPTGLIENPSKPKKADNDNDNDNEIKDKPIRFNFRSALLDFGFKNNLVDEWLQVRKSKKLTNTETAFNKFITQVQLHGNDINEILKKCIEKSWGGFEADWYKKETNEGKIFDPLVEAMKLELQRSNSRNQ
jgi:hypothetical protein